MAAVVVGCAGCVGYQAFLPQLRHTDELSINTKYSNYFKECKVVIVFAVGVRVRVPLLKPMLVLKRLSLAVTFSQFTMVHMQVSVSK